MRLRDRLVVDDDDLVEEIAKDRRRELGRILDRDAVGDRRAGGRPPGERRTRGGLHPDERQLRPQRPQRDRDPGGEAAAADRDHDGARPGRELLRELEPERPLAGDHAGVVEGVDEGRSGRLDVRAGGRDGVVEALAAEHDRRAVAPRRVHLGHRSALRDEDRGGDTGLARSPRHRLPVVAGARGDDAPLAARRR